jgi:chromosome segregation ATPase
MSNVYSLLSKLMMSEQKWKELNSKIGSLVSAYNKLKKERDTFEKEIEDFKKQNARLAKESKEEILLKERIAVLEKERRIVQEKIKNLLKIIKGL